MVGILAARVARLPPGPFEADSREGRNVSDALHKLVLATNCRFDGVSDQSEGLRLTLNTRAREVLAIGENLPDAAQLSEVAALPARPRPDLPFHER